MTSHRSTNILLLIIALLLGVIALQLGSRPLIGEAVATTPMAVTAGLAEQLRAGTKPASGGRSP